MDRRKQGETPGVISTIAAPFLDVFEASTIINPRYRVGERVVLGDKIFRYCLSSGATLAHRGAINSNIVPGATNGTGYEGAAGYATAAGENVLEISDTTAAHVANWYAGGEIVIFNGSANITQHGIVSSTASDGTSLKITLESNLQVALTATGVGVTLYRSPYGAVQAGMSVSQDFESFMFGPHPLEENDGFGSSVLILGDLYDDGTLDYAVGAPGYNSNTGRAYIFNGGDPMDSTADVTLTGEKNGDKFGYSVSSAGDMDGDGAPDVIVGAPYWDNGATTDCGQVLIFKGGSLMDTVSDFVHNGTQANEHFGWSVSLSLKVEGGTINSVVVGAPHFDSVSDSGRVEILNTVIPEYSTVTIPVFIIMAIFIAGRKSSIISRRKEKGKNQKKR